jgi:membrane protease YdiL (CAAX protease family)
MTTPGSRERRLGRALATVSGVWLILLAASLAGAHIGEPTALVGGFGAAAACVLATRERAPRAATSVTAVALGFASGFAGQPAWLAAIASVGLAVGLAPRPPSLAASGVCAWLAVGLLAPVFEELLYRERLIPALRAFTGAPLAIALSSALFAVPHGEAWSTFGSFLVGLALGVLQVRTGSVALCIAAHAGLNAASLIGVAPLLEPADSAVLGALGLAGALARAGRAEPRR